MYVSKFGPKAPGKLIEVEETPGIKWAYLPNKFPPKWPWPTALWSLLMEAKTALAHLDGVGQMLPDPQHLLQTLQNRETIKSFNLEQIYTIPEKQLLFQENPKTPENERDPSNAYRAVFNYEQALKIYGKGRGRVPDSLALILKLHRVLMSGIKNKDEDAGVFRQSFFKTAQIPHYVPTPPAMLPRCLHAFEKYLSQDSNYDPLVNAFLVHYQFSAIHPFKRWNGPVSRFLLATMITKGCRLSKQWLHMSPYFERNQDEYFHRLFYLSSEGKWTEWIEFCLKGVIEQAKDAEKRTLKLIVLSKNFKTKLREIDLNPRLCLILDALFISPSINIPSLIWEYKVSPRIAKSYLKKFVLAKIITELGGSEGKSYYAPKILNIWHREYTTK